MRYRKILSMALAAAAISIIIPIVSNAAVIIETEYEESEDGEAMEESAGGNGITSEIEAGHFAEDYFHEAEKESLLSFAYGDRAVEESLLHLVERTEVLKKDYSAEEAVSVLEALKKTVADITSVDYEEEYAFVHDEKNYEDGEFYKYKISPDVWIIKNILYVFSVHDAENTDIFMEIVDLVYDIAFLEMENGCKDDRVMQILAMLYELKGKFPESFSDYLSYVSGLAAEDSLTFENGSMPKKRVPSEAYLEKTKGNEGSNGEISNGVLADVEKMPAVEEADSGHLENSSGIQCAGSQEIPVYNAGSVADYQKKLEEAESQKHVETNVNEHMVMEIYFTLDKTAEHPVWQTTRAELDEESQIPYDRLVAALRGISNVSEDFFLMEDTDMAMFIAEGKPLVINRVEKASAGDIDILFDTFEKLGIKTAPRQDEVDDGMVSLTDKLNADGIYEIVVDGRKLILTNKAVLTEGIVQLPVKQAAGMLGYKAVQSGNTITLVCQKGNEEHSIAMSVGSSDITVNGQKIPIKAQVTEQGGIIYAEFDKIAEEAGYTYAYNAKTGCLELESADYK